MSAKNKDYSVGGEAVRKANIAKARAMLTKPTENASPVLSVIDAEMTKTLTSPDLLPGVGLVVEAPKVSAKKHIVTSKEAAAVVTPNVAVVQEQKKSRVKKPTAEQLGVTEVVGSRGKVRSENPAPLAPPAPEVKLCDIFAELTAHHERDGFPLIREVEAKLGCYWTDPKWGAEKNEGAANFFARAVKALTKPVPQATRDRVMEQVNSLLLTGTDPFAANAPLPAPPAKLATEPKVSKPRADGWNGLSSSAIFRWCGSQGWTKEECIKAIACLKLEGVQEKSLPTLLKAGKDGFRLPVMPNDAADELNRCVGRLVVETKPAPKKGAKK